MGRGEGELERGVGEEGEWGRERENENGRGVVWTLLQQWELTHKQWNIKPNVQILTWFFLSVLTLQPKLVVRPSI